MKTTKININIYDWDIYYMEIKGKVNPKKIKKYLSKVKANKESVEEILKWNREKSKNGGLHLYNTYLRATLIAVFNPKNKKAKVEIISHEIWHSVSRIREHLSLKGDESGAFMAGYISEKIFSKALKL